MSPHLVSPYKESLLVKITIIITITVVVFIIIILMVSIKYEKELAGICKKPLRTSSHLIRSPTGQTMMS